jgi:polysaccharide export outer membrane protein
MMTPALALVVHAGDELQVTVYNHPELSRKVTVDGAETVSLPLAGLVKVRGLDTAQIGQRIAEALAPYVIKPAVDVELTAQSTSVFISGGPGGVLKYEPGETLMAAIAELPAADNLPSEKNGGLAGLQRSRVDLHRVDVERDGASLGTFDLMQLSAKGEGGPQLQPGDTIALVNKEDLVHVLGDVKYPGPTYVSKDETLADAIAQAGGVLDTAASAHIVLERGDTKQSLALGDAALREPAQNGDVLVVPTAPRVSVVGMVDKPGVFPLKTDFSLLNAIYQAGGPTKWADLSKVQVVHEGEKSNYDIGALVHGDMSQNPPLKDGDVVFVPEGHKVDWAPIFSSLLPILYLFPK